MSGDTFTSNRFKWLEAITADSRLHSTAIRVAVVIASHLNRQSGEAFPSIKTIAAKSATPERSVERAVAELCKAGYLERRRGGFSQPNRYAIPETSPHRSNLDQVSSPATDGGNEADSPAMDGGSVPPPVADQSRHGWRTNPLNEPFEKEPIELDISPPTPSRAQPSKGRGSEEDARFEEFYRAYPKKASKGTARKAWARAVKLATPETIIAGAMRYAAERTGQDSTYTKHPATWLNAEAWNDEAAPPRPPSASAVRAGMSAKDRTAAAVAAVLAQVGGADEL